MKNQVKNKIEGKKLEYKQYLEDSATSLYNKNYFTKNIESFALQMIKGLYENQLNGNTGTTWTIMFCDIDGLKLVNDTLGHLQADEGIKHIADIIKNCIRIKREQSDQIIYPDSQTERVKDNIPIRFGGDEFIIILPNCTKEKAFLIEDRIKEQISKEKSSTKNMTLSIGVADTTEVKAPTKIDDPISVNEFITQLINLAEQRMYLDKNKDIRELSYEEKKATMIKHLARIGDTIGFDINNIDDINMLIDMLNDLKTTKKR